MQPTPILWWNDTIVALNDGKPSSTQIPAAGDPILAFCAFVENLTPTPKAIRLVYHHTQIESIVTPCPRDSRPMIKRTLSTRFPALANPATIWAAHKVRTNVSGTTTLLYIEQTPLLAKIAAVLEERGIRVEAAFPLLVLAEVTPPAAEGQPLVAILYTDSATAVFRVTADGDRHALFFEGATMRERTLQELVTSLSIFEGGARPPVFLAIDAASRPFDLTALSLKPTRTIAADAFLANAHLLKKNDTTNYLTSRLTFNADIPVLMLAAGIFIVAGINTAGYLRDVRAARSNQALRAAETAALVADTKQLTANQARIQQSNAVLDEAGPVPTVKTRFLEALNRARPIEITLHTATLNETSWTITGQAHEGAGLDKGPFQAFVHALEKGENWKITNSPSADPKTGILQQSDFTLSGTFQ